MKLSQCTYGVLVKMEICDGELVGMVVGITNNAKQEAYEARSAIENAIPLVQWSGNSEPVGVHHKNISVFKG